MFFIYKAGAIDIKSEVGSMRQNQNGRRFRGRNNSSGGGGQSHHGHHGGGGGQGNYQQRRVNPRVQTFDSNGPDVRIRGNAYQINEKYLALARDAAGAGDRVLAESYYQHAEHYQRFINEIAEEYGQQPQQQQSQPQYGSEGDVQPDLSTVEQPSLSDLDQGFLVGPRHAAPVTEEQRQALGNGLDTEITEQPPVQQPQQRPRQGRQFSRSRETETA